MATVSYHQQPSSVDAWTSRENKIFETALAELYNHPDRWNMLAAHLPGKSATDVELKYQSLQDDIKMIEAGGVPAVDSSCAASQPPPAKRQRMERHSSDMVPEAAPEKRKGVPWSEEEHRLFLLGLAKFGKGDWRSISRHFVLTRTPTQVASHAQKYFIRLNSMKKDRKRASIHDITAPQQQLQQIKEQVRLQQQLAQQQKSQEEHEDDMDTSPFAMVAQRLDHIMPAALPSSGEGSPYSDTLLHSTHSDGAVDLADWACSLLLPNDPQSQMQMSKSMPVSSSFLLPMC